MGYWVAQAQQYKDTSPPPRERKRRPEAGFVLLDTSSQALGALSLQNDTIISAHPRSRRHRRTGAMGMRKAGSLSLEGDKVRPAK
jgi:hypothetical protein